MSIRVLLAEDHKINRMMALGLLRSIGLNVEAAFDGADAVAMQLAEKFDCILMDLQMPNLDGFEATRVIRASGDTTPIIALSSTITAEDKAKMLDVGMNGMLTKPIDIEALKSALGNFVADYTV